MYDNKTSRILFQKITKSYNQYWKTNQKESNRPRKSLPILGFFSDMYIHDHIESNK